MTLRRAKRHTELEVSLTRVGAWLAASFTVDELRARRDAFALYYPKDALAMHELDQLIRLLAENRVHE